MTTSDALIAALVVRGIISRMPEEKQLEIQAAEKRIRALLDELGDPGLVAVSLILAEENCK